MINKDNNLNIDILRQQNTNIPLKRHPHKVRSLINWKTAKARVICITAPVWIIILALCSRKMLKNYQL